MLMRRPEASRPLAVPWRAPVCRPVMILRSAVSHSFFTSCISTPWMYKNRKGHTCTAAQAAVSGVLFAGHVLLYLTPPNYMHRQTRNRGSWQTWTRERDASESAANWGSGDTMGKSAEMGRYRSEGAG